MTDFTQFRLKASTGSKREFTKMVRTFPNRVHAIAEGDSWFDFPSKYVFSSHPSNVIDHMQRKTRGKVNLLRLASNGDEVRHMTSGDQIDVLCRLLADFRKRERPVDVVLFSGGGNDLAGEFRLDRVLKRDARGATDGPSCFATARLNERMKQVELAYKDLLDACARYSPTTSVVVHTYDYPYPDGRPARFLKAIKKGPWLKPYLAAARAPQRLHRNACRHLIDRFADVLVRLGSRHQNLVVADTRGTLRKNQWSDELHPTTDGFRAVARKVYAAVRERHPELRAWT